MKFNKLVAVIAIFSMAAQASAQTDGTLRRANVVAANDTTISVKARPLKALSFLTPTRIRTRRPPWRSHDRGRSFAGCRIKSRSDAQVAYLGRDEDRAENSRKA